MKKIFLLALMFLILVSCGCGSKYSDKTFILKKAGWVETEEYARDFLDALESGDDDFLEQQLIDKKIKLVDKETKVAVLDEVAGGKILKIKFSEGRYKNSVGYTPAEYVKDYIEEHEAQVAFDKQAYDSLLKNGIQINVSHITAEKSNYRIDGESNLPSNTKIAVLGVETPIINGAFSVVVAAPPGKQLNVRILGEQDQPDNVRKINTEIINKKGNEQSIFGRNFTLDVR